MEYISMNDLTFLGEGANSKVYKYNKPFGPYGLDMAVKVSRNARQSIANYEKLKETGCMKVYAELCKVDGEEAILMQNLFTDMEVYVSPNSYRNNHTSNLPETYLAQNKLKGIANMNSLLCQLSDLARCCDSKGIEVRIDMISFGVPKGIEVPNVSYKVVDVDGMDFSDECRYKLKDWNIDEAIDAINIFIENCVEHGAQAALLDEVKNYKW